MPHQNQAQPNGGWTAALAGAVLGTGLAVWWLAGDAVATRAALGAVTVQPTHGDVPPAAARPTPRPRVTPPPAAAAPSPIQYVGQWMDGGHLAVVLRREGRNVVVPVPGMVDGRYEVVSANQHELVLRDVTSATTQRIALGAAAPAGAATRGAARAPAEETSDDAEDTTPVRVRPDKLPPPSQRISDELEPEN